ncbi:hypothetical protein M8818_000648 [Zalaria obscura]|uniref:Uncharacterized protein n=1 Tax=Zalaria obscura TaxID=2024903 RepID=A0ACC3SM09_9PEZI
MEVVDGNVYSVSKDRLTGLPRVSAHRQDVYHHGIMSSPPGLFKQLWYKWRSLKLPWRRRYLVGADLAGNTFWEFKDALNANRLRRIVQYSHQAHYADVKISPQWHQWLRHTRFGPPSIEEQKLDVARQSRMKFLAAKADERWNSVPSFLDAPDKQQTEPAIGVKDPGGYMGQTEPTQHEGVQNAVADPPEVQRASEGKATTEGRFKGKTREKEPSPWAQQPRGNPGEDWQPQTWNPGAAPRR